MIREILIYASSIAFVVLWVQSSYPKFLDLRRFKEILESQSIPKWSVPLVTWLVPFLEALAIVLIFIPFCRLWGFYISFALMLIFTIYVGGIKYNFYKSYPCLCGAFFKNIGWNKHFWVNVYVTIVAGLTILLLLWPH